MINFQREPFRFDRPKNNHFFGLKIYKNMYKVMFFKSSWLKTKQIYFEEQKFV